MATCFHLNSRPDFLDGMKYMAGVFMEIDRDQIQSGKETIAMDIVNAMPRV